MREGDTFKIKSSWNSAEEKGKTEKELFNLRKKRDYFEKVVLPFYSYENDVRCSVDFEPIITHTLRGSFYESELRLVRGIRMFNVKYNPTFFQKNFPTFDEFFTRLKRYFRRIHV